MKNNCIRGDKRIVQAWVDCDLMSKALFISTKNVTGTLTDALDLYVKSNKSELLLAQERYESVILEATRLKVKIDELTKKNLKETKKEIDNEVSPKKKEIEKQLTEEDLQKRWEFTIWPIIKKKISEQGFDNVINDERLLNNFSKGLCISTGELKEKIRINRGVV